MDQATSGGSGLTFPLLSAFVAIPLDEETKTSFASLQDALLPYSELFSFQKRETPHLTLQFWQELMEIEHHQVLDQLQTLSRRISPFAVRLQGVSTFGEKGRDRVLFVDVPFSDELARLRKACPWPLGQPFTPHVTLVRIKHPEKFFVHKKKIMKVLRDVDWTLPVTSLGLYGTVAGQHQVPLFSVALHGQSSSSG